MVQRTTWLISVCCTKNTVKAGAMTPFLPKRHSHLFLFCIGQVVFLSVQPSYGWADRQKRTCLALPNPAEERQD